MPHLQDTEARHSRFSDLSFRHLTATAIWIAVAITVGVVVPAGSWAQGNSFVVTGTERVFVRRGPGTEFPPFATLTKGTAVEVQEMRGEWARITTASGQTGYVNSTFLAPPGERETDHPIAAPAATPPSVAAPPAAAAARESTALRAATERNKSLETQVRSLQQELTELKSRADASAATPAAVPTPAASGLGTEQVHADLARLTASVEAMQRRLDVLPVTETAPAANSASNDGAAHVLSPGAVLLGMLGLLGGWIFGSSYGRRQERGRRARIRF